LQFNWTNAVGGPSFHGCERCVLSFYHINMVLQFNWTNAVGGPSCHGCERCDGLDQRVLPNWTHQHGIAIQLNKRSWGARVSWAWSACPAYLTHQCGIAIQLNKRSWGALVSWVWTVCRTTWQPTTWTGRARCWSCWRSALPTWEVPLVGFILGVGACFMFLCWGCWPCPVGFVLDRSKYLECAPGSWVGSRLQGYQRQKSRVTENTYYWCLCDTLIWSSLLPSGPPDLGGAHWRVNGAYALRFMVIVMGTVWCWCEK